MKSLTMKNKLTHYETKFEQYEASHMELRNGANGDMFNCIWKFTIKASILL